MVKKNNMNPDRWGNSVSLVQAEAMCDTQLDMGRNRIYWCNSSSKAWQVASNTVSGLVMTIGWYSLQLQRSNLAIYLKEHQVQLSHTKTTKTELMNYCA